MRVWIVFGVPSFGAGSAASVRSIAVRRPSGAVQRPGETAANRRLSSLEPRL